MEFDGLSGKLIAPIMARMNAAAEREAVDRLAPQPTDSVLVLGFGPGVGLKALAASLPQGLIVGIDPSKSMYDAATRRCRALINAGRITLHQASALSIPSSDQVFDGAIAVHTLQFCTPHDAFARELARVMKPNARFVSITHGWAPPKHGMEAEQWMSRAAAALSAQGFHDVETGFANAEKETALLVCATRSFA